MTTDRITTRRSTCRLCESSEIELAVPLKPSPIADAYVTADEISRVQPCYPLDLYLCQCCGHVQLLDVVNPAILFDNYIYTTSKSQALVEHFRLFAGKLLEYATPPPDALAIEIGSNDGTFLGFLKSRGLRVIGVDPAGTIAATATNNGIETLPAFFSSNLACEIRDKYGPAWYVIANNVFAHSDNLSDMADGIRVLLAPNGIFVFEVSYLVDIVDKLLFDTVYHEHLSYHSLAPLMCFLPRHGLELFDVTRVASKGGSIQCWVQLAGGSRRQAPIIEKLLTLEARMGLSGVAIFEEFARKIATAKTEIHNIIGPMCSAGRTLAGYGASATVTTLIYNFELGEFLTYLIDDDPARFGLISPGHHLPVMGSDTLAERKPKGVVVLAWQYADQIVGRNQRYLSQGGHFVIPLPKARVICKG